jgi:FolB domain-containing protein
MAERYDKIFINDLRLQGIVGINPEERIKSQTILVNVVLFLDTRDAAESQSVEDTASYSDAYRLIIDHIEHHKPRLVEALAADLATLLLARFPMVARVRVRVEKLDIMPLAASVGVEIERAR